MNERIKELARQAGAHVSTRNLMSNPPQHIETMELWDDRIEKFAELLVRDMAECVANDVRMSMVTAESVAFDMKMRYGVE